MDGPVALANALGGLVADKPKRKSVYDRLTPEDLLGTGEGDGGAVPA